MCANLRVEGTGYTSPPIGLALDDADHPGDIAAVAESHVVDTESARYKMLVGTPSGSRRLRLLSALLRIGDILDEAQHRALRSKAETLQLNDESLVHWWRHYYTCEVVSDPTNNLITIFFEFPQDQEREYESIIPELQMPWVRREFDRHRRVFAANRLTWTVTSTVRHAAFSTLDAMPPKVMVQMLRAIARQKAGDALTSRNTLLEYEEKARSFGSQQISRLQATRNERNVNDYLQNMERAALDLHEAGGTLSAVITLREAIFFSTKNGRSVEGYTHVSTATTLSRLLLDRGDHRDAVRALIDAEKAATTLLASDPNKAHFYRWLAKANILAGDFTRGRDAAKKALQLLLEGPEREELRAALQEATMLEGLDPEEDIGA